MRTSDNTTRSLLAALRFLGGLALVAATAGPMRAGAVAPVCTYNDATTSFNANYFNNTETSLEGSALACTAGSETTAVRVNGSSYGRATITSPNTGDYKFLMQNQAATNANTPLVEILISSQMDLLQFPDGNVKSPTGLLDGGCDDSDTSMATTDVGSVGINTLEQHLHRAWPLWGQSYLYGDFNANPPNDPGTVITSASAYSKWWTFDPAKVYSVAEFRTSPDTSREGTGTNGSSVKGWYPAWGGDLFATAAKSKGTTYSPYSATPAAWTAWDATKNATWATATACASVPLASQPKCAACLAKRGYYLQDKTYAGDHGYTVMTGEVLNDYPPAWVHAAWAYGYLENFKLHDVNGLPVVRMGHSTDMTQTSSCDQTSLQQVGGNNTVPPCNDIYPTYDWAAIQGLNDNDWDTNQKKGEGQGQTWASKGGIKGNTPAADYFAAVSALLQRAGTGSCSGHCQALAVIDIGFGIPCGETRAGSGVPATSLNPACAGDCAYVPTGVSDPFYCSSCATQGVNLLAEAAKSKYVSNNIRGYFIGFGTHTGAMKRAAAESHGKFLDARDANEFHDALMNFLAELTNTATSTTTSTTNAVQVNAAAQEELLPRFVATSGSSVWEGHLQKYFLFSEFAGNCTAAGQTKPMPNANSSLCNATCVCPGGACTASWLMDAECSLLAPDSNGNLVKANWVSTALVPTTTLAVEAWDAQDQLQAKNWYQRKAYTAIDSNGDGKIDASDGVLSITTGATAGAADMTGGVTDAVADALAPYMALDGTFDGVNNICQMIESTIGVPLPGAASVRTRACARVILNYALGEDLRNQMLAGLSANQVNTTNRLTMLGDIFHSAPQEIGPPPSEADCVLNPRRCVHTLYAGKTDTTHYQALEAPASVIDPSASGEPLAANPGTVDAYEAYYRDQAFSAKHPRVTLFGANDGWVHAVQTACYSGKIQGKDATGATAWYPTYYEGAGHTGCVGRTTNNGEELWAFIPPDLLPKLALMLLGQHQIFADSTPMVRDIYAPTTARTNGTKRYQKPSGGPSDFRRVAIFGEREGGTHWTSLDVTDPTTPGFLWTFPQPYSAEALTVGFSMGDWVPNAPPIVPIRAEAPVDGASAYLPGFPSYTDALSVTKSFQEKWVVMLPGGYDPYGIGGRALYMIDAWTGTKVFGWTGTANRPFVFPFAALPATVAWGTAQTTATPTWNYAFADTAIVGDLGGQAWTLRFNSVLPTSGTPVWTAARSFRQFKSEDGTLASGEYSMAHKNPIFQMAAVARMTTGDLRAFIGTGDRQNMSETDVGDCSLYNPLACGKRSCVMTIASKVRAGDTTAVSSGVSSYKGDSAATYTTSSVVSPGAITANTCSPTSTVVNACVSCSAGAVKRATVASPDEPQFACVNSSTSTPLMQCKAIPISATSADRLETTGVANVAPNPATAGKIGYFNRFLAFNVFDSSSRVITNLDSAAGADTYDGASYTESNLTNLFSASPYTFAATTAPTIATTTVTGTSAGYLFYYPRVDERTATNSVLMRGCVSWYTMEPSVPCTANSECAGGTCTSGTCVDAVVCASNTSAMSARQAFLYTVNAENGTTSCGLTNTTTLRTRASVNSFVLPPPAPQSLVSVNASGQVQFGLVTPVGQASPAPAATAGASAGAGFNYLYTIEAPRELHECRHNYNAAACY